MSWGLGYLGQPHLVIRYMAIRSSNDVVIARRIAILWAIPGIFGAFCIGILSMNYFGTDYFLTNDPEKGGISEKELIENWQNMKKICGIKIIGLMTINPKGLGSKENYELFKKCRSIANNLDLPECSMGMSQDWEEAVKAGSTWVRMGSLIFGERFS